MSRAPSRREDRHLLRLVAAVVIVCALYFARIVFIPLALSVLVAVVLTPAVAFLERMRLRRGLAIFVVMLGVVCAAVLIGWTVLPQFGDFMGHLPEYEQGIQAKVNALKGSTSKLSGATESVRALEKEIATGGSQISGQKQPQEKAPAPGTSTSRPLAVQVVSQSNPLQMAKGLADPLGTGLAVLVFAIFILAGREDLRDRLIKLTSRGRLNVMTQAMSEAWNRINRYLFMQLLVNSCYGLTIGFALHFLGVPRAALWGFLAGLLRYLPYIGWMIAAASATAITLAVFPGWTHALICACIFIGMETVVANGLEPLLYGAHVGLAPLAILIAAIFWTLLWGFPGLLLSTPMTVCLVVVGRYVPSLSFLNTLLGNEPVMAPDARYYQRLLAGDRNEARQILDDYLRQSSPEILYERVLIPALVRSKYDALHNELDEETRNFIDDTTRDLAEEVAGSSAEAAAGEDSQHAERTAYEQGRVNVLCFPARDEADEVAGALLCRLLERRGMSADTLPAGPAAEMLADAAEMHPSAACISMVPPLSVHHARGLYAKLRRHAPAVPIAVCLWHFEADEQRIATLLRLGPHDRLFTTLSGALRYFADQQGELHPAEFSERTHAD